MLDNLHPVVPIPIPTTNPGILRLAATSPASRLPSKAKGKHRERGELAEDDASMFDEETPLAAATRLTRATRVSAEARPATRKKPKSRSLDRWLASFHRLPPEKQPADDRWLSSNSLRRTRKVSRRSSALYLPPPVA